MNVDKHLGNLLKCQLLFKHKAEHLNLISANFDYRLLKDHQVVAES
jgi:hypothetical protein